MSEVDNHRTVVQVRGLQNQKLPKSSPESQALRKWVNSNNLLYVN